VALTTDPHSTREVGTKRERASFNFDGVDYVRDTNTITDLIPNATINLRGPTDSYETITITADVELMKNRLADFIQAYNELVDFINPPPLTPDDEKKMQPLSDKDAANMTVEEIEDYNAERERLLHQKAVLETGYFKNLYEKIQSLTVLPAGTSSMYESLSALGITTGELGETAHDITQRRGKLLVDSVDRDKILQAIEENSTLMDALTNHSDELYKLFGTTYKSRVSVVGTKSLSNVHLSGVLRFAIGSEGKWASIYMAPGFYTAGDVVNIINSELARSEIESVRAYLDASNHIVTSGETEEGKAQFEIRELNDSLSLSETLGLPSGGWEGEDVSEKTGLARRLESYLNDETGIRGVMYQYVKPGGLIDMRLDALQQSIDMRNDWLSEEEERLRRMFINMEMWLGQYKSISAFIQQRTQSVSLLPGVAESVQNQ
jgi:flagellar capping protein FliD